MKAITAMHSHYRKAFLAVLLVYVLLVWGLAGQGDERFVHLHLLLDTGNGILSLMLAIFLLAEQSSIAPNVRKYLAVSFALAASTEILHALIGIEWSGTLNWVEDSAYTLRPATWPPSTYVLPLALLWALRLKRGGAALSPRRFALGMTLVTFALFALSLSLPKYVDTGVLGIQRPTQAPLLLLWLVVIRMLWRERATHPLFEGLAWMGVLLFLSDLFMLYSTSPHEKFTMMAHAGKLLAYTVLHLVQMRVAAEDSRARVAAETALQQEKINLQQALQELKYQKFALDEHAIVGTTDVQGRITYANQQFCDISGYTMQELLGSNHRILNSGLHPTSFFTGMYRTIAAGRVWHGEICNRAKDGHLYWVTTTVVPFMDERGKPTQYISIRSDITERKAADEQIHQLAFFDVLTHLPNRRLLADRVQHALRVSERNGRHGALLFLDLDHFKTLNDTQGHDTGDLLLIAVGERLQACVREGDTVARLGGDEFVVVLENLSADKDEAAVQAEAIGEKIRDALDQPYQLKQYLHRTTSSIGIVLFDGHDLDLDGLLKHADAAMYQAKNAGRNAIRFYDAQTQAIIEARVNLSNDLHDALDQRQFQLYYQLQVGKGGHRLGAEVLLRWHHPRLGLVAPLEFIPLAEHTGLIVPIGLWVLRGACAQIALWQHDPVTRPLTLAVNVSAKQFHQADFADQVRRILAETGAPPARLKLELTESIVLDDVEQTIAKMQSIQKMGVCFSIDDFGTGYSSLSYLKRLPLDEIKIDQGFVRDLATDANDAAIVQTIIAMTGALGLNVIAEGVETEMQRAYLDALGCHDFQGYLFGKPVPLQEFEALLGKAMHGAISPVNSQQSRQQAQTTLSEQAVAGSGHDR